jgi:hypothetical protein
VLYYDSEGAAQAIGAEAVGDSIEEIAKGQRLDKSVLVCVLYNAKPLHSLLLALVLGSNCIWLPRPTNRQS